MTSSEISELSDAQLSEQLASAQATVRELHTRVDREMAQAEARCWNLLGHLISREITRVAPETRFLFLESPEFGPYALVSLLGPTGEPIEAHDEKLDVAWEVFSSHYAGDYAGLCEADREDHYFDLTNHEVMNVTKFKKRYPKAEEVGL